MDITASTSLTYFCSFGTDKPPLSRRWPLEAESQFADVVFVCLRGWFMFVQEKTHPLFNTQDTQAHVHPLGCDKGRNARMPFFLGGGRRGCRLF